MIYYIAMENLVYYQAPYQRTLDAVVTKVGEPNAHALKALGKTAGAGSVRAVQFDKTIFYPEGGGQPGDCGTLIIEEDSRSGESEPDRNLAGSCFRILDTQKLHNNVDHKDSRAVGGEDNEDSEGGLGIVPVHLVECADGDLVPGMHVKLVLDWEHRYSFMQYHTAQHLLSGLMFRHFQLGTVAVHLGQEDLTIEIPEGEVSDASMRELEDLANDAILKGLETSSCFMTHGEAEKLGLRRSIKVSTAVRIVRIGDIDSIACGGLHVGNTSECRIVLYQGQEKIRGNVRTIWKAAGPAMEQVHQDRRTVKELCALQSAQPEELTGISVNLQKSLAEERQARAKMATMLASAVLEQRIDSETGISAFVMDTPYLELKNFGEAAEAYGDLALAVLKKDEGKLLWLVVLKGKYGAVPFSEVKSKLLGALGARGGGKPPMYQGMATETSEAARSAFLDGFRSLVVNV